MRWLGWRRRRGSRRIGRNIIIVIIIVGIDQEGAVMILPPKKIWRKLIDHEDKAMIRNQIENEGEKIVDIINDDVRGALENRVQISG